VTFVTVCGGNDSIPIDTGECILHTSEDTYAFSLLTSYTCYGEIVFVEVEVILEHDPIVPMSGIKKKQLLD